MADLDSSLENMTIHAGRLELKSQEACRLEQRADQAFTRGNPDIEYGDETQEDDERPRRGKMPPETLRKDPPHISIQPIMTPPIRIQVSSVRFGSKPQEPSPHIPINRPVSSRLNGQQRNAGRRVSSSLSGIDRSTPYQTSDRDGGDLSTATRARVSSKTVEPDPTKLQQGVAKSLAILSPATVELSISNVGGSEPRRVEPHGILLPPPIPEEAFQPLTSSVGVSGKDAYRYTPLERQQFRLLRVLVADSKVKCEILHRSFEHPPSYAAISYAWGDPADTTNIMIRDEHSPNPVEVRISKNLYLALEALQKRTPALYWTGENQDLLVWADALSIDQQNPDEKNGQLSLMADIYRKARYVAIWLGPEENDSHIATVLLRDVVARAVTFTDSVKFKSFFSSRAKGRSLPALAALFEREYWNRLWVVQEIFNAASIYVFCGYSVPIPWHDYHTASLTFRQYKKGLEDVLPRNHSVASRKQYSYSQILAYSGPGSLPELSSVAGSGDQALLQVLRVCRGKLSSDPRDKVFGVLGLLDKGVCDEFAVNYAKSVKDVYTDVVEFLLTTTNRLDVICESIHFPVHTSSANLPTWVPDWSHMPSTSAISLSPGTEFAASRTRKAAYRFLDGRRNLLEISAVSLGSIISHGIPVGTLCTLQDYLMAFLHWRALLLGELGPSTQGEFCETICFGQIPPEWKATYKRAWMEACFHVFARLIQERIPYLAIDNELAQYAHLVVGVMPGAKRKFLQDHFGSRMMGRCFCLTSEGRMGLGTGFMAPNDEVVIPLGCSTPVLLRPEGNRGEFRFVGDIYVNGYMHGEAMDDLDCDKRQLKRYILH